MHAEREELVKRIFPQLRKLCEQRGVTWGEVDLRWGVTDEQKAEGKVLPICLEEIQRCRPYFIGLLGERYGWVPDEIPRDIIQSEPWLAQHRYHSITELEITHGVLNNPEMAKNAYFYFRDTKASKKVEAELAKKSDYQPESEDSRSKLKALKKKIEESGFSVRKDFPDPKTLGELVLKDLTSVIDRLYPTSSQPDPLDREAIDQESFAISRTRVYIERKEYFNLLNKHVEGNSSPMVVLGESGSGKSALLANWALQYRERINQQVASVLQPLILMHFTGASPYSTDWATMLRRIMGEFKRRFDIGDKIPDRPDELRSAFTNWLHMAAAKGKVILILDGLNQLEDRDGALDLIWLPPHIPDNIRLILSTLPGRPLDELRKRCWSVLEVTPLDETERQKLITQYLGLYRKSLNPVQVKRIASATQSSNPLYLRVLLEELRVYGDYDTLNERMSYYLEANTVSGLYSKVLSRYEEDYERDRPGLTRDTMSLLWAARRGLSEVELLGLLGSDSEPLPHAQWSPLYLAAESSLISRSGLIGFGHDYLREAVKARYLRTEEVQKFTHLQLAGYFEIQEFDLRKVDELPWQLMQAKAWKKLYGFLANRIFLCEAWKQSEYEVLKYWAEIERNSTFRMVDAYSVYTDDIKLIPTDNVFTLNYFLCISGLLSSFGYRKEALRIQEELVERDRQMKDKAGLINDISFLAQLVYEGDELDKAWSLLEEAEPLCRELGDLNGLEAILNTKVQILRRRNNLESALIILKEAESICSMEGLNIGLGRVLLNQANILSDKKDFSSALSVLKRAEHVYLCIGNYGGVASCLGNQAQIMHELKDFDSAMSLHIEEEKIFRETGEKKHLCIALVLQAQCAKKKDDIERAMILLKESEQIYRQICDNAGIASTLLEQAVILVQNLGQIDVALPLIKEGNQIASSLKSDDLQTRYRRILDYITITESGS